MMIYMINVGTPSCGVVSLHFALNTTLRCLTHHTLYISKEYTTSWNTIDNPNTAVFNCTNFNFYIHAPSRTDLSVCPQVSFSAFKDIYILIFILGIYS